MSPYDNVPAGEWHRITAPLVERHPLTPGIADFCLKSWESILNGKINTYLNLKIREMSISPQATGALLHDVIPEYITKNVRDFRKGTGSEKDIVCVSNDYFSVELKTSSQKSIFGNRSYTKSESGKSKSGYYLTINFEKISSSNPRILLIQFGWLDYSDWIGQKSETGQQASLKKEARQNKLLTLYEVSRRLKN
ncbi:MAG: ScaI family restriction endonuclease [Planctomycetaceae bacterium]|nr:ScaI family restriction endonuclease [Planctomycetaceae bacterium]